MAGMTESSEKQGTANGMLCRISHHGTDSNSNTPIRAS